MPSETSDLDHADAEPAEREHASDTVVPRTELVQSLSRGLAIICAFDRTAPSMTLSQVAARTGVSRAVARRFLHTLASDGYVSTDGKYFRLTPRVLDLGFAYLSSLNVWDVAQPIMQEVVASTGESCSASVLDGTEIVYVARVAAGRIMQVGLGIGSRLPAYCSSMGRVLLAAVNPEQLETFFRDVTLRAYTPRTIITESALRQELCRVAAQGWSLVDEELETGLRSLSVPIRRRSGQVIAAMNVSCHASAATAAETLSRCLPVLLAASEKMARGLPN
jgi:IclR family transcriptional regulator, pca regulon regulatory protein